MPPCPLPKASLQTRGAIVLIGKEWTMTFLAAKAISTGLVFRNIAEEMLPWKRQGIAWDRLALTFCQSEHFFEWLGALAANKNCSLLCQWKAVDQLPQNAWVHAWTRRKHACNLSVFKSFPPSDIPDALRWNHEPPDCIHSWRATCEECQ